MNKEFIKKWFNEQGEIINLIPIFIPRRFGSAGRRLKLHPDDYFHYGMDRGSIKERWFSSIITAMNGENAAKDEGMSVVNVEGVEEKVYLKDFVDALGADLLGKEIMETYGTWPMYSKFFDYEGPLFHHLHLDFEHAAKVGKLGKPEAYYYPPQLNNYAGNFPHTYFGFNPSVTKEQVKERLALYKTADNRITELSRAYRIELGSGWYTPPGVLHAPGSYLTYEPQWNDDVNSVYENYTDGEIYPYSFLVENCPESKQCDLDYVLELLDWEANVVPDYKAVFSRPPIVASESEKHIEKWISYANPYIAAKELTVYPNQEVVIKDNTAYGFISVQGHGSINGKKIETPVMLRFGQKSNDEYFVGYNPASKGVVIKNESKYDDLVILKHFPNYKEVPQTK